MVKHNAAPIGNAAGIDSTVSLKHSSYLLRQVESASWRKAIPVKNEARRRAITRYDEAKMRIWKEITSSR